MHIDWWTLALQTINVVVLIWLLSRFLYRPVMNAIAARQAAAAKILADAEASRAQAQAAAAALKLKTDEMAAKAAEVLGEARAQAKAERAALLEEAAAEIADQRAQALARLEGEAAAARKRLEADAVALASDMARKLLRRAPAGPVVQAMFADLIARLEALPPDELARLIAPGTSVALVTAAPLGGPDQARFGASLRKTLPKLGEITFRVDAGLIAGFELKAASIVVANSWRADLEEIAAALKPAEASGHAA